MRLLYSAAHADFPDTEPLGGGKAVADYLIREWRAQPGIELAVLSPQTMGLTNRPLQGGEVVVGSASREGVGLRLAEMSERRYARFCREFERAVMARILEHEPTGCVVLANDISEGPDFAALGARGYRVVTIFHVDVVDYFTKFYLRGWVRPALAAKLARWPLPEVLKLVFRKQADCVRWSRRLVVPSAPMSEVILRCYPDCAPEKIVVVPWGNVAAAARPAVAPYADDGFTIVTLSRLSPEKGIERLLRALPLVRGRCRVWICGAAAYMSGRRYERRLRRIAPGNVEFLGHVTGERKAAILARADLFVSASRHESYGLTIAEAEAAGCRVISHGHYGARGRVVNCDEPASLAAALDEEISRGRSVKEPVGLKSDAADRLAEIIRQVAAEA